MLEDACVPAVLLHTWVGFWDQFVSTNLYFVCSFFVISSFGFTCFFYSCLPLLYCHSSACTPPPLHCLLPSATHLPIPAVAILPFSPPHILRAHRFFYAIHHITHHSTYSSYYHRSLWFVSPAFLPAHSYWFCTSSHLFYCTTALPTYTEFYFLLPACHCLQGSTHRLLLHTFVCPLPFSPHGLVTVHFATMDSRILTYTIPFLPLHCTLLGLLAAHAPRRCMHSSRDVFILFLGEGMGRRAHSTENYSILLSLCLCVVYTAAAHAAATGTAALLACILVM